MRKRWCRRNDLNVQPTAYKAVALPIELRRQINKNSTLTDSLKKRKGVRWCRRDDLNARPTAYEAVALPTELRRQNKRGIILHGLILKSK